MKRRLLVVYFASPKLAEAEILLRQIQMYISYAKIKLLTESVA